MANGGSPGTIAVVTAAVATQAAGTGNILPPGGKTAAATAASATSRAGEASSAGSNDAKSTVASSTDPQTLVDQINKYLNDSGRPDQFRVDPDSAKYIQQVNPANGAVLAQFSVSEFPALARSIGASSLLFDGVA